jgi:Arc/MetJ family transcription regulator
MFSCIMRTTIDLSDELARQAKRRAAEQGVTLREIIEEALRGFLGRKGKHPDYSLRWRTEKGRLLPGIDLDDRDSLFDRLDGRN